MSQMDHYREDVCSRANELLKLKIPEKLSEIDQLLQADRFKVEYCDEARQFAIDSLQDYENALKEQEKSKVAESDEHIEEGPSPKKAKSSNSKLSIELKSKTSLTESTPKFPTNEKVIDLFTVLKPELILLSNSAQLLKDWISLHVPKHEDGNNFGVEVQEDAINELMGTKEEALQVLEEQSAYHMARAQIVEKIVQEGNIEDLKVFIYDEDEKQCRRLRNVAMAMRTNYTTILDMITKNYERIIHPKGYNAGPTMY